MRPLNEDIIEQHEKDLGWFSRQSVGVEQDKKSD